MAKRDMNTFNSEQNIFHKAAFILRGKKNLPELYGLDHKLQCDPIIRKLCLPSMSKVRGSCAGKSHARFDERGQAKAYFAELRS
jgi:hypothetical protein